MFSSADLHNFAPDDKIKYLNDMTTERDIRNQIAFAKDKGFEEGREEGREEGFEDGIKKGREEGREEGIEEGRTKKQLDIAGAMLKDEIDIKFISKYTGLSEEQIAALK